MKVLLVGINAKYIHTNLAIYSLLANAGEQKKNVKIVEYTINHTLEEILQGIYIEKPDIIGFSVYLWNVEYVKALAADLKKVLKTTLFFAGGPEVSYDAETFLQENEAFDFIMVGEGELCFKALLNNFSEISGSFSDQTVKKALEKTPSLVYRDTKQSAIKSTEFLHESMDMDDLVFPYDDFSIFENKILYYESIRGCPFRCSYCLSSIDKTVRQKSLEKTKKELDIFLKKRVRQVKFVDRTFNCDKERAYELWKYLRDNDNGVTNFHFEIAGDLLTDADVELFSTMRQGLIQLEIGVQSTNQETLKEIKRVMNIDKLSQRVSSIKKGKNIHQHLDLIAGLPFEDKESFIKSFNDVYKMRPDQLQLGFLKVLKGSYMDEMKNEYSASFLAKPPYEVLQTAWLSYDDIIELKTVERMVETYYNSLQFVAILSFLEIFYTDAYKMFLEIGRFYEKKGYNEGKQSRVSQYRILWEFICEKIEKGKLGKVELGDKDLVREIFTYDFYLRDYVKNAPEFVLQRNKATVNRLREHLESKSMWNQIYINEFCVDFDSLISMKKLKKTKTYIMKFDYSNRDKLSNNAQIIKQNVPKE